MTSERRVSAGELARLRLLAQRIAGPGFESAAEAVGWLTAVQAQDFPGAVTSVALRTRARSRAGVEAALNSGAVVRSWPMRGTLHFVAAEDLPWLLQLTAPRVVAGLRSRYAQLELDARSFEWARELAIEALTDRRQLSRADLFEVWQKAGLSTAGQRGVHLIGHLAQTGTLCFGPIRGTAQELVLLAEWVPRPRQLDREAALAELALRYFRSHGPATAKDLGRWGKLVAGDVRTGVAQARAELERIELDGVEYLLDPATHDLLAAHRKDARGVHLLPGFDEYMLGYGDRTAALPAEFADRIVPGGNGMFRSTVVADGQVVGTWSRLGRPPRQTVDATPFTEFTAAVAAAIGPAFARLP